MPTLLVKTWKDHWRGALGWAVGLISIVTVQLSVFPSIRSSGTAVQDFIKAYPDAFKEIFRISDYSSGPGYLATEVFSFMVPLIFLAVGAAWGASLCAGEEERGTADLLFTLPISRTRILTTFMAALGIFLVLLDLLLIANLVIGNAVMTMGVSLTGLLAASTGSMLLGFLYGAIAFLVAALTGKRAIALGISIGLAIGGFLFYSLAPLVDTFDVVTPVNPFEWALGENPLVNGFNWVHIVELMGTSLVIAALAVLVFRKREIPS